MKDVMKIALGIAAGLVIAGIAWIAITTFIVTTAATQIIKTSQDASIRLQKNANEAAQKQREQQALIEAAQRNAKAQELRDQQAILELQQAAIELRKEKAKAWEKFYTKSPECVNPPTMNAMGECANIAIRTKRQFEDQWNASHSNYGAM